jgi:folate-dependent phosphoribosylglycinamide formyltransferase PurN
VEKLHERIKEQEHRLLPKILGEWRERGLPVWDEAQA